MACPILTAAAAALTARGLPASVEPWEGGPVLMIATELDRYAAWIDRGAAELHTEDLFAVVAWGTRPADGAALADWVAGALTEYEHPLMMERPTDA